MVEHANNDDDAIDGEFTHSTQIATRQEHTTPTLFDGDATQFRNTLMQRMENHQALIEVVLQALDPTVDLVRVHFVSKHKCDFNGPPKCTFSLAPWHWSDLDLSKRGAEKINGLLGLSCSFPNIKQYIEGAAMGRQIKDVILDCDLLNHKSIKISHGNGSCSLQECFGDLNRAIKMAGKRAHIDAIKRCGGLSGLATEINKRFSDVNKTPEQAMQEASRTARQSNPGKWNQGIDYERCPIGKEIKGKLWREIESEALQYLVDRVKDKPDVTKAAARELAKRRDVGSEHPDSPTG